MSRIAGRFQALAEQGRKALVPYIVAGDPALDSTVPLMHQLVAAGADIIELGVPFSDPMSEGPVIQLAHERALANGVRLRDVIAMVQQFREQDQDTPVLLMGYANPVVHMGFAAFADAAAEAGLDALLTVDIPPEEVTRSTLSCVVSVWTIFSLSHRRPPISASVLSPRRPVGLFTMSRSRVSLAPGILTPPMCRPMSPASARTRISR